MFYEEDARKLEREVRQWLREAPAPEGGRLRAAVVPHAGYVYSGSCAAAAYAALKAGDYDRVIVLAPSHTRGFRGLAVPASETAHYATPLGPVAVDRKACDQLADLPGFSREPDVASREHAVEVQLPFLQAALGRFNLVPVICGSLSPLELDRAARALAPLVDDKTLVIASSDFTHYGEDFDYLPFTDRVREQLYGYLEVASSAVAARDKAAFRAHLEKTGDTICGRSPIDILLGILDERNEPVEGRVLARLTSGDRTGDYRHCVSYAAIGFFSGTQKGDKAAVPERESDLSGPERKTLLAIARDTLEWTARGGTGAFDFSRYAVTDKLKEVTATFVTLKIDGHLRGCIGSLEPEAPLFQSVHDNAVHAASHDPRFTPVQAGELGSIHVDVSVLSPIRPIRSWTDFKIGKHGIIMTKGRRKAVYLPEVAPEQGWTVEETLASLSEKAGLPPDAWKEGATFQVFESRVLAE
jgi:AmmeMemoRadiSam system protein B/AmmeMemoRadiSam system protein A